MAESKLVQLNLEKIASHECTVAIIFMYSIC